MVSVLGGSGEADENENQILVKVSPMEWISAAAGRVAAWSVRRKMNVLLLVTLVLLPLSLLLTGQALGPKTQANVIVALLVGAVILFAPLSWLLSHLMASRSIRELNDQCYRLKQGDFTLEELPPERGEEHDFLRLKRNLHWMGYALAAREERLSSAMQRLSEAQHQIGESIDYAALIQRSFLPDAAELGTLFSDHFLLWDQRDRVGGDSYWMRRTGDGFFVAVIDCTGHGVPGAFMTLIVHALFEQAADTCRRQGRETDPGSVLSELNRLIKDALGQNEGGGMSDDGLDCGLCHVNPQAGELVYAGARNPLYVLEDQDVRELRGDRCGIGYVRSPRDFAFSSQPLRFAKGQRFYMATDGAVDQVGGTKRFPFGKRRLKEFFLEHAKLPLAGQDRRLAEALEQYRGEEPRRDDITVLGFEIEEKGQ